MSKYRRKPQLVEACLWDGSNTDGILDLKAYAHRDAKFLVEVVGPANDPRPTGVLEVVTIDGNQVNVPIGAYVVLDPYGFPYPCSADVFKLTFEDLP